MSMLLAPLLLHGALGWWDEILCLIPSVLLIALVIYIYRSDRRSSMGREGTEHEDPGEAGK